MKILGIEGLRYGVTHLAEAERFLDDWGFERAAGAAPRFLTQERTWIELRAHDDAALPPPNHAHPAFDGSCVREIVWGVDGAEALAQLADGLGRDHVLTVDADGTLHTTDPAGNAVAFMASRRLRAPGGVFDANVAGAPPVRVDRQADGAAKGLPAPPLRINHAVYMAPTPQGSVELAGFYRERLGFRLSDSLGAKGFFLRPGGSSDHHNLLVECFGEGWRGVQHVAIEYRDLDHLMHRGAFIESRGWQSHVGPGRHTLGSNFTWYFWSPLGGLMELVADMDQLTERWQPRSIDPAKAGPPWAWLARPFPPGFRFGVAPRRD